MGNGEKWWETVRNGEKRWETVRNGEKRWDTVRDGERRRETMRDGERRWGISAHIHRSIQVILAYKHRHCQTPPDTTRHHQTPPDMLQTPPDMHQTMSDRLAVVLWWFIELYSWSRFFLPTGGRTDERTKVFQSHTSRFEITKLLYVQNKSRERDKLECCG